MKRRHLLVAGAGVAAAAAGAGVAVFVQQRSTPHDVPGFWTLSFDRPEGGNLDMASLRGRPLLVNFWATWCAPCVKEMPLLDEFHRRRRAAGWRVVGLAVDSEIPVREYLAKLPMSFPIGLAGPGGAGLSRSLGNTQGGLPFSVVFDTNGRSVARKLGAVSAPELADWGDRYAAAA